MKKKPVGKTKYPDFVIIPENHPNPPEQKEIDVADYLYEHYGKTIEFIIPVDDYKRGSVDILIFGQLWEIKAPDGNSKKHTIKYQFDRATQQGARQIIITGALTKLDDDYIISQMKRELSFRSRIKKAIFITKSKKVVELFDKL